jgi:hypothetical protein
MSRSAEISWRKGLPTAAMLLPLLALPACSSHNDQAMTEKLTAAQAAADRAVAAQHAAEKAALQATSARPAAAEPPAFVSDSAGSDNDDGDSGSGGGEASVSLGGERSAM